MLHFQHPVFLYGFFAIAVPILIHLFNFRRYRTVYFSNVKLLKDIQQKTKRESQLQHLIVLMLRILAISMLVLAFAQPYIPRDTSEKSSSNLVTIYVDNSFSMEVASQEGNLFQDGIVAAKNIVNAFSFSDKFALITNDFSGKNNHLLNRDEMLAALNEVEISPRTKESEELFEKSVYFQTMAENDYSLFYYLSDFQKSRFDVSVLSKNKNQRLFLMPLPAEDKNNVSIDSCWFLSPVFKMGQQVTLTVRVHNYGTQDLFKIPLRLSVNNEQKAIASVDVKADSYIDYQLKYTLTSDGIQRGVLEIEDSPIVFDDVFYFTYQVQPATHIVVIHEKENPYIRALYGSDSLFVYEEMNVNRINYSLFNKTQLIVLDQVKTVSSGLAEELGKFVQAGGSLLLFPALDFDKTSWDFLLKNNLSCNSIEELVETDIKVGKINHESIFFKDAIERYDNQLEMPTLIRYFTFSQPLLPLSEVIMELENKMPLLFATPVEKGMIFFSAVALNDEFGAAHKNALFFIPLHNIGIKSQRQAKIYATIGKDEYAILSQSVESAEDFFVLKLEEDGTEFIPEQRKNGQETILYFYSQIEKAGFYDVEQGGVVLETLAFNFDRRESDLKYFTKKELQKIADQSEQNIELLEPNKKDLTRQVMTKLDGVQLWRWFLLGALLFILIEVIILRFWGKFRLQ